MLQELYFMRINYHLSKISIQINECTISLPI